MDLIRNRVRNTTHNHAAIRVATEHDIVELLPRQKIDDLVDMGRQI